MRRLIVTAAIVGALFAGVAQAQVPGIEPQAPLVVEWPRIDPTMDRNVRCVGGEAWVSNHNRSAGDRQLHWSGSWRYVSASSAAAEIRAGGARHLVSWAGFAQEWSNGNAALISDAWAVLIAEHDNIAVERFWRGKDIAYALNGCAR